MKSRDYFTSMNKWNRPNRPVILASGSPRRKELLQRMGITFSVEVDSIDDEQIFFEQFPVQEALMKLARAKAKNVAENNPDSLVIGSDTIVVHNGEVLGKPKDREDAFRMLKAYSGKTHSVFTCVSLESISAEFHSTVTAETKVTFRELDEWEITNYLDTAHYQDKAGAYGIQDDAMLFVDSVNGCYTNVVGFPVTSVITLFQQYKKTQSGDTHE